MQPGVPAPPSLVNIYKELKRDLNIDIPNHGYLQSWADQGHRQSTSDPGHGVVHPARRLDEQLSRSGPVRR